MANAKETGSTAATVVIFERETKTRHTYCDRHFREAMRQCPLGPDEAIRSAKRGDTCEECPL